MSTFEVELKYPDMVRGGQVVAGLVLARHPGGIKGAENSTNDRKKKARLYGRKRKSSKRFTPKESCYNDD